MTDQYTFSMHFSVAVVGLERTFYNVSESVGTVEVCAVVLSPDESIECPVDFPFNVSLSTNRDTAGSTVTQ